MKKLETLGFKHFCMTVGNLPSSYVESLSYYECLMWLCNYLQETVIPTVNNNAEAVEELQGLFIQLQQYVDNYFDNLDVQEEINNKLDVMASNGTLSALLGEYREFVHIKELGCIGDGTTDNATLLQEILDNYDHIYIDEGVYYSSQALNISDDTVIDGKGTIKSTINIVGEIGESVTFSSLEINKINTNSTFEVNELLKIYYEDENNDDLNKRQMVVTTSTDGKLSNNLLNYGDNYIIKRVTSVNNVKINNITIEGRLNITYSKDVYIDKIKMYGVIYIDYSYNINVINTKLILGNEERIDICRGSSNITIDNLNSIGGNTVSDNSALKFNEAFYSTINNCSFGSPNRGGAYNGTFHAIMIDGDFAEDNYPINESQFININNCNITNGYSNSVFISLSKNININNVKGYSFHNKYSDNISVVNSNFDSLYNEISNTNLKFSNSYIGTINTGVRKNMIFDNCKIDTFTLAQGTDNIKLNNCIIDQITNTYVTSNSAHNIMLNNCEVLTKCELKGIQGLIANIITHASAIINETHNSNIDVLVIENVNNTWTNISIQTCSNDKIYYQILDSALATTPVNIVSTTNSIIETSVMRKTNNNNANYTQNITKGAAAPTSDTETHYRGEIIYNYAPTAGGYVGWICVTGGTPGTWKGFGSIES